ncbi:hypothetical protein [Gilvimarinus japonicus]|uniref:NADH dehydrogenase subunit 5 n=1 Tax=Gilvimarinus japonicus TaxID=1796469 RepID=A0ABV7HTJ0_9GAMM
MKKHSWIMLVLFPALMALAITVSRKLIVGEFSLLLYALTFLVAFLASVVVTYICRIGEKQ